MSTTDEQSPGAARSATYTRGEVAYLLGLTREDALLAEALPPSSANLNGNESSASRLAYDDTALSTLVRWSEVHQARRRVIAHRLAQDGADEKEIASQLTIAVLRSWGLTGADVAEVVGLDRFAAERRFNGLLRSVVEELGGEAGTPPTRLDAPPPACLKCGQRPRIRSRTKVRRKVDGRRQRVVIERQTSLCAVCLDGAGPPAPTEERGTLRELHYDTAKSP